MMKPKERIIKKALRHIKRGDIDKAIEAYGQALSGKDNDPKILIRLAAALRQQGHNSLAVERYMEAGQQLKKMGFPGRAISLFNQVLEIDDSNQLALANNAELYAMLNQPKQAISFYQRLAGLYEREEKAEQVIEVLEKIHNLDPLNPAIAARLSDLYFQNHLPQRGYQALKPLMDSYRKAGNKKQLLRLLEKVAEISPDNTENLRELVAFYLECDCLALAYKVLAKINQQEPEDILVLRKLADISIDKKWSEQAVTRLKMLKSLYLKRGLKRLADGIGQEILLVRREDPSAGLGAGEVIAAPAKNAVPRAEPGLAPSGDKGPATEPCTANAEEAENADPRMELNNPEQALSHYKDLVLLLEGEGKREEALEVMEKIHHLDPGNLTICAKLAKLYFSHDRPGEAYATLKPVIKSIRDQGNDKIYLQLLKMVEARDPENLANLSEMSEYFLARAYPARAYNTLIKIHRLDPNNELILRKLADLARERGWNKHAITNLTKLKAVYESQGHRTQVKQTMIEILGLMQEADIGEVDAGAAPIEIDLGDAQVLEQGQVSTEHTPVKEREIITDLPEDASSVFDGNFVDFCGSPRAEKITDLPGGEELVSAGADEFDKKFVLYDDSDEEMAGPDPTGGLQGGRPVEAAGGAEPRLHETVVFCPFPPIMKLMAEIPGANPEAQILGLAELYTVSYNGRQISLVGPAPGREQAARTLEGIVDRGARNVIVLDLCGRQDNIIENARLVLCIYDARDVSESAGRLNLAINEAIEGRHIEHQVFSIDSAYLEDNDGSAFAIKAAGSEPFEMFTIARERRVNLGCVTVVAPDFSAAQPNPEAPALLPTDVWQAGHLVLEAAFKII